MSFTTIRYSSAPENRRSSDYSALSANPGLIEEVDGYYDWAGRRLFLADRSADPMTPGAYRYQTRPDLCDLAAPESDPSNPRYEPPHLRHQPGDTWLIEDDRPHDPDDPGPFGSVCWRQDRRTGRHRRGELPDPIPPWDQETASPEPLVTGALEPLVTGAPNSLAAGGSVPPWKSGPSAPAHPPESEEPRAGGSSTRTRRFRVEADERSPSSSASPRRSPRPWSEADYQANGTEHRLPGLEGNEPYRFGKLREDAWDRFIYKSAELAAAHHQGRSALERECGPVIGRWVRAVLWGVGVIRGRRRDPDGERRTALAGRSTRVAGAVRGVQRARIEASARGVQGTPLETVARDVQHARTGTATRGVQGVRIGTAAAQEVHTGRVGAGGAAWA